jgi:hypothetical protein
MPPDPDGRQLHNEVRAIAAVNRENTDPDIVPYRPGELVQPHPPEQFRPPPFLSRTATMGEAEELTRLLAELWEVNEQHIGEPVLKVVAYYAVTGLGRDLSERFRAWSDRYFRRRAGPESFSPRQTDRLVLPITEQQIDAWPAMKAELEGLLKGERLLGSHWLRFVHREHELGMGLNLKKLMDDPPAGLLSATRLREKGIDAGCLEPEEGKLLNVEALFNAFRLFDGSFGFAYAARFN